VLSHADSEFEQGVLDLGAIERPRAKGQAFKMLLTGFECGPHRVAIDLGILDSPTEFELDGPILSDIGVFEAIDSFVTHALRELENRLLVRRVSVNFDDSRTIGCGGILE
jgi:hypothetical protein